MEMGLEMQESARPIWSQMNGNNPHHSPTEQPSESPLTPQQPPATAHHDLPPIAAITSCRQSSSPALKAVPVTSTPSNTSDHVFTPPRPPHTPSPSPSPKPPVNNTSCPSPTSTPSSPRDRRDDHIFALPNPPRPVQTTTRAPTPFPDAHSSSPHVFQLSQSLEPRLLSDGFKSSSSRMSPTPIAFNIPSQSAFATVPRPQPIRVHTKPVTEVSQSDTSSISESFSSNSSSQPVDTKVSDTQQVPTQDSDILSSHEGKPHENSENTPETGAALTKVPDEPPNSVLKNCSDNSSPGINPSPVSPISAITVENKSAEKENFNNNLESFETTHVNTRENDEKGKNASTEDEPSQICIEPGELLPQDFSSLSSSEHGKPECDKESRHQHLTLDGMKSYSNQNRRYMATPVIENSGSIPSFGQDSIPGAYNLPPSTEIERRPSLLANFSNAGHIGPASSPVAVNAPFSRATPPQQMPNISFTPNAQCGITPSNHLTVKAEIARVPSRSSLSPACPSSDLTRTSSISPAQPPHLMTSPNISVGAHHPPTSVSYNQAFQVQKTQPIGRELERNFESNVPRGSHSNIGPEQYRSLPKHSAPPVERTQLPPNSSLGDRYNPAGTGGYHRNVTQAGPNFSNTSRMHLPDQRQPNVITSNYSGERGPSASMYSHASRGIPHSAHSERPLAFHTTANRQIEPPKNLPFQNDRQYPQDVYNKSRFPEPAKDRGGGYAHLPPTQRPSETHTGAVAPRADYGSYRPPDGMNSDRARAVQHNKPYSSLLDFNLQQPGDKTMPNYPGGHLQQMHKNYPPHSTQPVSSYQVHSYAQPVYTSSSGVTVTAVSQKRPDTNIPTSQIYQREPYATSRVHPGQAHSNVQYPSTHSRSLQPADHVRQTEVHKSSAWQSPCSNVRNSDYPNAFTGKVPMQREPVKQIQLPQDLAQLQRTGYPQHTQPSVSPRERERTLQYPHMNSLPRANPPAVVNVSSAISPKVAAHHSAPYSTTSRSSPFVQHPSYHQSNVHAPSHPYPSRPSSSSSSASLPRMNFPTPGQETFNNVSRVESHTNFVSAQSSHQQQRPVLYPDHTKGQPNMPPPQHTQSKQHPYATSQAYQYQVRHQQEIKEMARTSFSPYAPSRGHAQENDICRNPFELPAPGSTRTLPTTTPSVIKSNFSSTTGYSQKPSDAKHPSFPQRPHCDSYGPIMEPKPYDTKYDPNATRYPAPTARTQQRSVSGSDERQKPVQLSARFPPVPQSNFDLQRQIYDRMTGLQQAPPRLLEKGRTDEKNAQQQYKVEPSPLALRQKRESPLDLSVKTVRQSADSTRDDVELYASKHYGVEPRLASAPKIDFNPNFAGSLIPPDQQPLPPVQTICKFPPNQPIVGHVKDNVPPVYMRKRPNDQREMILPPKIPKVDAWKLAMDEKIEERLKTARPARHPTAPLTPMHPPAQSVTPTNPEVLQPSARPNQYPYPGMHREHLDPGKMGARGWSSGVFQPPSSQADPDRIVQQISQGVIPDTRILQDNSVVDKIRSSLEEKEARLQALQAAARRQQPLPSFNALGLERMRTPPSYPQPAVQGAEPVPIGVEATRKYMRGPGPPVQDPDIDGLAAFLAARIRTKAEMKQMGTVDTFRHPDLQGDGRPMPPGRSTPKNLRDARLSQGSQGSRRNLKSPGSEDCVPNVAAKPRDPSGIRSSSETSVFDFRESDSEGEAPNTEKATLEGMRRPRKTQPPVTDEKLDPVESQPGPAPKPKQKVIWGKVVDALVQQLQTRPIKRSVRKKKPNPKFFTDENETPKFLKTEPAEGEENIVQGCKEEPVVKKEKEDEDIKPIPLLPEVTKEESNSSDDINIPGLTVVKEGKVKIIVPKKERAPSTDSEWATSLENSSSSGSDSISESESDDVSEDSTARKVARRARGKNSSGSEEEVRKRRVRTRNRLVSESDNESVEGGVKTRRKNRRIESDSEESDAKAARPRTRSRPISESDDGKDDKPKRPRTRKRADSESGDESDKEVVKKKTGRIQTRQQARTAAPTPMKLRSKKLGKGKGVADDIIKFKKKCRVPDKLIGVDKNKKVKKSQIDGEKTDDKAVDLKSKKTEKNEKKAVTEKDEEKTKITEDVTCNSEQPKDSEGVKPKGKNDMMLKRSVRGSLGVRRSNKAVQNSKRHLNNSAKRPRLRRKFRSGFDYMRKNKKKGPRKDGDQISTLSDGRKRDRSEISDISAEIKTWVVNKSAGETLLHRASRLGYTDVVIYCLESLGMSPSPKDNAGYTPLHEACSRGHINVAENLLQYGASVSESAPGGVRPLHQAVENNHLELVRLLLAYGADPQLSTYKGETALSLATDDDIRDLIQQHIADIAGDEAPKWNFDGPASIFDPKWAVDTFCDPPSPGDAFSEVEFEASRKMLPPLYRLSPAEGEVYDPTERWLLLSDVLDYLQTSSSESILARLSNTLRRDVTDKVFIERAAACNVNGTVNAPAKKVTLLRYDDAVKELLDVETSRVSTTDE